MIDQTQPYTIKQAGLNVLSQGDGPLQLFTYGKILLLRKDHCIVLVSAGPQAGKKVNMPLVFPATIDGVIYHVDVPEQAASAVDAPVRAPRAKAAPGETKIAKCRAIFAANKDLDKDAMIAKFVADAGCTPQGAVTYYITCRKG
jgi:hypothetical protein